MFDDQQSQEKQALEANTKALVESWDIALRRFEHNIYPMFKRYGFTLPEAFLAFKLNEVGNSIDNLVPVEDEEEDEPWRKK